VSELLLLLLLLLLAGLDSQCWCWCCPPVPVLVQAGPDFWCCVAGFWLLLCDASVLLLAVCITLEFGKCCSCNAPPPSAVTAFLALPLQGLLQKGLQKGLLATLLAALSCPACSRACPQATQAEL
jgi:hypothetical protein